MRTLVKRLLPMVLVAAVLGAAAGAVGYATRSTASALSPEEPAASAAPGVVRGTVQSVSGRSLVVNTEAGPVTLHVENNAGIETLRPATISSIRPGDWVNVGAVRHQQTLFAITSVVVIPEGVLGSAR